MDAAVIINVSVLEKIIIVKQLEFVGWNEGKANINRNKFGIDLVGRKETYGN
jgi:hypothetical protein